MLIVEVEKDLLEAVFYSLKDVFHFDTYLDPDETVINLYVSESKYPVVVKKLTTRSPIDNYTEEGVSFHAPALEKMMVDLFAEPKLFYFYQGTELTTIYRNIIKTYAINYTTLFSYAKRRERDKQIMQFIKQTIPEDLKYFV
jgi:hypothetical protein